LKGKDVQFCTPMMNSQAYNSCNSCLEFVQFEQFV